MRENSSKSAGVSGIAAGVLWLGLLMAGLGYAQPAPGGAAVSGRPPLPDTIDLRASWALEQLKAKNAAAAWPALPAGAAPQPGQPLLQGQGPEFSVTGIRGFAQTLEASFVIGSTRVSGSLQYPTLVDGWKVVEVTPSGATIERKRERKQLPFGGSSPYQPPQQQVLAGQPPAPSVDIAPAVRMPTGAILVPGAGLPGPGPGSSAR
jgi:hypothetical protein